MAAPRRKYTNEMKLNAVHLVQNEGRRACDVADELGIDLNTLYAWLRDARNGKLSTDDPAREGLILITGRAACRFISPA